MGNVPALLPAVVLLLLGKGQAAAGPVIKLVSEKLGPPPARLLAEYPAVVTHTHNWRFSGNEPHGDFDEAEKNLVAWCVRLGIRAVGVGSAWDPANDAMFQRFEGPDRDLYYSGKFDQKSVMQTEHIQRVLAYLNQLSQGRTHFYLDNETPKTSMGHVWWFGYSYDYPAWHDYSQDRPIHFYRDDPAIQINPLSGLPHTRRSLFEIMAIQHHAGALGVFAHPTRWWIDQGRFVSNIAVMAGLFLAAAGRLDGLAIMGDRPFNKPYQDLWFHFLDTGSRVPGFAETDFFLNQAPSRTAQETFRNYPHLKGMAVTEQNIRDAAARGEVFVSNGAFLAISVDGVPMGSVCETSPGKRHRLRIQAYPEPDSRFSRIEVIGKYGEVWAATNGFAGGVLEFEFVGSEEPGYVVVRAFGPGDAPDDAPAEVKRAAVTNPVYLYPRGFHVAPATTSCLLRVAPLSRWVGGRIEFQQSDGRLIESRQITPGAIRITLPASARVLLQKVGERDSMFYIAMENSKVEDLLSYLRYGEFRKDYPGLHGGEVPPRAFRLPEMREALRVFEYDLK
jgi:hypothetical protein